MDREPNQASVSAAQAMIQCGLDGGYIKRDFTLKGHRDVRATDCPGDTLYSLIQNWPHFKSGTTRYADC